MLTSLPSPAPGTVTPPCRMARGSFVPSRWLSPSTPHRASRASSPGCISNLVLFLASDEARYITGQQIRVDAGSLLKFPNGPGK